MSSSARFGKRPGSSGAPATAGATTADQKPKQFVTGCPDPQRTKLDKLSTVSALRSAILVVRLSPKNSWTRNP